MRAAVYHGPGQIAVQDLPRPVAGSGEIVVAVSACGICGTDLHVYRKGLLAEPGAVLGPEFSGRVVEVGAGVAGIQVGDRVTAAPVMPCRDCARCRVGESHLCERAFRRTLGLRAPGALAEFVRVPSARLGETVHLLPPEVSDELGALVEPLTVAMHALHLAGLGLNDQIVIFGAGTIGQQALEAVRHGGRVVAVALFETPVSADPSVLVRKEVRLQGSVGSSAGDFASAIALLRTGRLNLRPLVTHRFSLESVAGAFGQQLRSNEAIKVLVCPGLADAG